MSEWKIENIATLANGKKAKDVSPAALYPIYGGNGIMGYTNSYNTSNVVIIGRVGAYCGSVHYSKEECWISDNAISAMVKDNNSTEYLYYLLTSLHLNRHHIGGAQPLMTQGIINNIHIPKHSNSEQKKIAGILSALDEKIETNRKINAQLEELAQAIFKSWFIDFEPFGGRMPEDWETGKLSDVLNLIKNPIKSSEVGTKPYLPIDFIPMNRLGIEDFDRPENAQSSLIEFSQNDILIGAMRVYFHRVVIAPFDGVTRTTCFVLRPKEEVMLPYLLLLVNQNSTIKYADTTSKGTTMPYAIWENGLGDMEIKIPSSEKLSEFNHLMRPIVNKIREGYKELKILAELRDTLLPKLMSGEIKLQ